jgi:hypothetical protein
MAKRKFKQISSFGRRQDVFGARGFGAVTGDFYRGRVMIAPGVPLPTHTLVHVYFNDADLEEWSKVKARCKPGTLPTVNHRDPRNEMRSENHYFRLEWATGKEQRANQIRSAESKASYVAKISVGRVQARRWRGRVRAGYHNNSWAGGTPDEWDDTLVWMGSYEAGRHTGHNGQAISPWLNDGEPHYCRETKQHWEYRLLKHIVEPGYEDEKWFQGEGYDWWPQGLGVSKSGRVRVGDEAPILGSKMGNYRSKAFGGAEWRVHELMGWAFFGPRPSEAHTVDHDNKTLDADGCLSNALSNLLGWADKSEQIATKRNGSRTETSGKPVVVRVGGVETEYGDGHKAAAALGVTQSLVGLVCNGKKSRQFEAWFAPQPDLTYVHAKFEHGKLTLTTEVERWADIDPADWVEGGKYVCVRRPQRKRKDISTAGVTIRPKKPRRKHKRV